MDDLKTRFETVARGRPVRVEDKRNALLSRDFEVAYEPETNSYTVAFTSGGYFEEAFRFIERWIKRSAEDLDGVSQRIPASHFDCRDNAMFWIIERVADRHIGDCVSAIEREITVLERERPNEGVSGEVTVEARIAALRGFMEHLASISKEVRTAVLSPKTIEFLTILGLNCFTEE